MTIISVSRRTDIPAYYFDWFLERLKEGYVLYPLPFSDKLKQLDLNPQSIDCIVFWSKNYAKLINNISLLDDLGYCFYCHFTINNYPEYFENDTIETSEAIHQLKTISEKKSPNHIHWRYDPIIITKDLNINFHLYNFEFLAKELSNYTRRCYIEFIDMYKKVQRNFDKNSIKNIELTQEKKQFLVNSMAEIATNYNIEIYSCCNETLVNENINKANCIDPLLINKLNNRNILYKSGRTRQDCGCAKSIDIGEYGSCLHGCLYCYANNNIDEVKNFHYNFNKNLPALDSKKINKDSEKNTKRNNPDVQLNLFN